MKAGRGFTQRRFYPAYANLCSLAGEIFKLKERVSDDAHPWARTILAPMVAVNKYHY